jgi:hypothetical protein
MQDKNLKKTAKQSKRYPFIAEHRGGPLTKENHRRLIRWSIDCCVHVLYLLNEETDKRLAYALDVAKEWENDNIPTSAAMKASLGAHAVARETSNPVLKAIARAVGQTVATAHMADHSLGGAFYALKAVKFANKNIEKERAWQVKKLSELPSEIIEIVQTMWIRKELDKRI